MATCHLIATAGYAIRPIVLQNMWLHKNQPKASCCSDVNAIPAGFRLRMEVEGHEKPNFFETIFMNMLRGRALVGSLGGSVIQARAV